MSSMMSKMDETSTSCLTIPSMSREDKRVDLALARAFGERLHRYREDRALSQRQLGLMARVDPMQVSRYERGTTLPATDSLVGISKVLQVSVDALLFGRANREPEPQIKNILLLERLRQIDELDRHGQEILIEVIDAVIAKRQMAVLSKPAIAGKTAGR